jgi:hypothetical protein
MLIQGSLEYVATQPIPIPPNPLPSAYDAGARGYSPPSNPSSYSNLVGRQRSFGSGIAPAITSGMAAYHLDNVLLNPSRIRRAEPICILSICTDTAGSKLWERLCSSWPLHGGLIWYTSFECRLPGALTWLYVPTVR